MSLNNRFNPPAVMFARLVYIVHLAAGLAGLVAILGGIMRGDLHDCAWGAAALWLTFVGRMFLLSNGRLAACERSANLLMSGDDGAGADDTPEGAEFEALLERRDELELRRGTAAFDPWEILTLQHQIDECVRRHPELAPLLKLHEPP